MGAPDMEHPYIAFPAEHQGVQLAKEPTEILRIPARKLQHIPVCMDERVTGQPAGSETEYGNKEKEDEREFFHRPITACTRSRGRVFRSW